MYACGSKTGLGSPDADVDAPMIDARVPDMRRERCILVDPALGPRELDVEVPASLAVVDLAFVIDASGSMSDEIAAIRSRIRTRILPAVRETFPDPAFALAIFSEFPVMPHARPPTLPYDLRVPVTRDALRIEAALGALPSWGNMDVPESQIEALYQVATGRGAPPWIPPQMGCAGGGTGGACFREDALPVVLLITDAPTHNGPPGIAPVEPYNFPGPHGYQETIDALRDANILVVGLGARDTREDSPLPHLRAVATATGATANGSPLVFDIGSDGADIGDSVVGAIRTLASGTPLDVDAVLEDLPGDDGDVNDIVTSLVATRVVPPNANTQLFAARAMGVSPGSSVHFIATADASRLPPSSSARRFRGKLVFRAFERSRLGEEILEWIVPGDDPVICEP